MHAKVFDLDQITAFSSILVFIPCKDLISHEFCTRFNLLFGAFWNLSCVFCDTPKCIYAILLSTVCSLHCSSIKCLLLLIIGDFFNFLSNGCFGLFCFPNNGLGFLPLVQKNQMNALYICYIWMYSCMYLHSLKLWRVNTEQINMRLLRKICEERRCGFFVQKKTGSCGCMRAYGPKRAEQEGICRLHFSLVKHFPELTGADALQCNCFFTLGTGSKT